MIVHDYSKWPEVGGTDRKNQGNSDVKVGFSYRNFPHSRGLNSKLEETLHSSRNMHRALIEKITNFY